MEFSFGSLQINKSNPAFMNSTLSGASVSPVDRVTSRTSAGKVSPLEEHRGFQSYLMDAINNLNSQQVQVANLQKQVITDPDSIDVHDVTTAMAKAKMSLDLAQTVIDRLVNGWTELSQNR